MKLIKEFIRITKEQQLIIKQYQEENCLTTKAEAYRHLISHAPLKNKIKKP